MILLGIRLEIVVMLTRIGIRLGEAGREPGRTTTPFNILDHDLGIEHFPKDKECSAKLSDCSSL